MSDRVCGSRRIYDGKIVSLRVDELEKKGGGSRDFEVVEHPGGVVIIAQPQPEKIVLVRQRRHAVDRDLWEVPAGKLEGGEDPMAAALRELREETGYRARTLRYLWGTYTTPGFSNELLRFYVAEGLQEGEASPEPSESFELRIFSVNEAWAMVERDELRDAKTQIALAWARACSK
ncbi:MAG: NUDIX hydrolase [Candidatus Eremiobacteraeota bacterium]|nr:NUDIX hydrolase [Candidatus Eremiobacteraeota bacterium]